MIPARIRRIENLHIVLWLLKDTCWVLNFKLLGVSMILPTIFVAIYITWISKKIGSELFHNLAVCCWISANSIWMIGEFFYDDTLHGPASAFFILGLISVFYYYIFSRPAHRRKIRELRKLVTESNSPI